MKGPAASLILSMLLAGGTRGGDTPLAMRVYRGTLAGLVGRDGRLLAAPAFSRCGDWREERLWVDLAARFSAPGQAASAELLQR